MSGLELPGDMSAPRLTVLPAVPGGVLHGALLRPPRMLWDGRRYGGSRLQDIDVSGAQRLPGVVQVVRVAHFVGVVAVSAVSARQALDSLAVHWQSPVSPGRDAPTAQAASDTGSTDASAMPYVWQIAQHPETQGQGVTVWCTDSHATVWSSCDASHHSVVQQELASLLDMPADRITLIDIAQNSAKRNHILDVMDAAADAALLSRAVGQPVHVAMQRAADAGEIILRRETSGEDATSTASACASEEAHVGGGATSGSATDASAQETPTAARWTSTRPWGLRPSLARLLSQPAQSIAIASSQVQGTDDIAFASQDIAVPLAHASIAELEAMQVFAQESLLDEEAARLGVDPMVYRLSMLPEGTGRTLAQRMADQSNWSALATAMPSQDSLQTAFVAVDEKAPTTRARDFSSASARQALATRGPANESVLRGRGYAAAQVRDTSSAEAATDIWSAWVVEVEIAPETGRVEVTRLVVGHDSQSLQPAQSATIRDQDPRLLETARKLLTAPAQFDDWGETAAGNPAYENAHTSRDVMAADIDQGRHTQIAQPINQGQLALDGVVTLPAAAAIGNAIFDATGIRLRQVPFNIEQLRVQLADKAAQPSRARSWWRRNGKWLAAGASAVAGLITMAWPLKPAIAPTAGPDVSLYSAAAIERGRLVAAAGDCVVCHTAPRGKENAGGLGLDTPFGTIYTTNITPDNETGIGQWSYRAFERAMREGVHRDGRQLYPAFPYTAFAKMTDADMQALYAYLMVQPPVRNESPKTALPFPYNVRPMMAGWNLLFHDASVYQADPAQSLEWNRGAYLVEGAGHCAACHSPRNRLGGEKTGIGNYLAGGEAEGWEAPPLDRLATGKVPWTSEALFQYLRTGYSASHGVAAGPMAPVIHGLAELPESDVRAIATYLMNLPGSPAVAAENRDAEPRSVAPADASSPAVSPSAMHGDTATPSLAMAAGAGPTMAAATRNQRVFEGRTQGERIYQNACAVCHEAAAGPTLFGVKPLLATNTNLHAATPDNLVQVILHGIQAPANDDLGYMPGFKDSLDDAQVQDLLSYLRARFAPQEPEWVDSMTVIDRIRNQSH